MGAIFIAWGPPGLLFLSVLDSAGVPIVGGVDLLLITIAISTPKYAYVAAGYATLGSLVGSSILYGIARKGGEPFLAKRLSSRQGRRLHSWFEQYGLVTVFIPALSPIPLPMKIPVFCAGALEVRWIYFASVVLAARVIRYFALAYLGMRHGSQTFLFLQKHVFEVGLIALILAMGTVAALRFARRAEHRRHKAQVAGG